MNHETIRDTSSLCPVCRKKLPARLVRYKGEKGVFLQRSCPEHGHFSVCVWHDEIDFQNWIAREPLCSASDNTACSGDCAGCTSHLQDTCCVLLEITKRCNLRCRFCFANGGTEDGEPSVQELMEMIDEIVAKAGKPLIQFSGGEPTQRDDLPALVRYAKKAGCSFTQLNTNGLRLAVDEPYVKKLAEAGLDIVFLQFDGTEDHINITLRGRTMLQQKLKAIENCSRYHIGVTLVPTVVRGVNDTNLGEIIRLAVNLSPTVRAVHFQPVTYLGRCPEQLDRNSHYTLDELLSDILRQTGLQQQSFIPSRCDHALCGFHGKFLVTPQYKLLPLSDETAPLGQERTTAERNRHFVGTHWQGGGEEGEFHALPDIKKPLELAKKMDSMDFDSFVRLIRNNSLILSSMAFQDITNINLERLQRCSLHVYHEGKLIPFCGRYLIE